MGYIKETSEINIIKNIGEGAYSRVYKAEIVGKNGQKKTKTNIALKQNMIPEDFDFIGSVKELDILWKVKECEECVDLISLHTSSVFTTDEQLARIDDFSKSDIVHFGLELASGNLMGYIRTPDCNKYKKSVMLQIVKGLQFLHANKIIHRDIKTENLLVFKRRGKHPLIKYCDFGMSRAFTYQGAKTPETVTSNYRCPEICLEENFYDYRIDIWSLGCVLFEIISKKLLISFRCDGDSDENIIILNKIIRGSQNTAKIRKFNL